jgi:hypothetical protein
MAEYPSVAKAQVEAGMPPYLSAQLQRGQVLKKTIVYKAGATATAGEIVRVISTSSLSPAGAMIFDPAQYLVDNGIEIDGEGITYERLKEKYNIACIVSNTVPVAANKSLTIVMDLIIP